MIEHIVSLLELRFTFMSDKHKKFASKIIFVSQWLSYHLFLFYMSFLVIYCFASNPFSALGSVILIRRYLATHVMAIWIYWRKLFVVFFQFFTTEPFACNPLSLPKYPPSKEMDLKLRDEEARRYFCFLSQKLSDCFINMLTSSCS